MNFYDFKNSPRPTYFFQLEVQNVGHVYSSDVKIQEDTCKEGK